MKWMRAFIVIVIAADKSQHSIDRLEICLRGFGDQPLGYVLTFGQADRLAVFVARDHLVELFVDQLGEIALLLWSTARISGLAFLETRAAGRIAPSDVRRFLGGLRAITRPPRRYARHS